MDRRRPHRPDEEPPGARLARSYLGVRADQLAEQQPRDGRRDARTAVGLPRLDRIHVNSPEALAQYRLALLARLAAAGEPWFTLARPAAAPRRPRERG